MTSGRSSLGGYVLYCNWRAPPTVKHYCVGAVAAALILNVTASSAIDSSICIFNNLHHVNESKAAPEFPSRGLDSSDYPVTTHIVSHIHLFRHLPSGLL